MPKVPQKAVSGIPFLESQTGVFSETTFGDAHLRLITAGRLNEPIRGILIKIIESLRGTKAFRGKMCSVYLILGNQKRTWYVSVSGESIKPITYDQAGKKLKKLGENLVLISASPSRKSIPEKCVKKDDSDSYEDLERQELFKKFLTAALSDYNGNDKDRYPELKKRFALSDDHDLSVKVLQAASKRDEVKAVANARGITFIDVLCDKVFYPKKLGAKKFSIMAGGGIELKTLPLVDVPQTKNMSEVERFVHFQRRSLREKMSEEEIEEIYKHIDILWEHLLKLFTNFEASHLLSHCSESNLIDYLYEHKGVLSIPGQHYLFSFKLTEENAKEPEIHELCGICNINAVEHFSHLQKQSGRSGGREIKSAIPIKILTKEEAEAHDRSIQELLEKRKADYPDDVETLSEFNSGSLGLPEKEVLPEKIKKPVVGAAQQMTFLPPQNSGPSLEERVLAKLKEVTGQNDWAYYKAKEFYFLCGKKGIVLGDIKAHLEKMGVKLKLNKNRLEVRFDQARLLLEKPGEKVSVKKSTSPQKK